MEKSILIFKCLADQSRINIINNLIETPMYVELLAERLKLSPSTVSFHLKKLEEAGMVYSSKEQYYVMYYINKEIFNLSLLDLVKTNASDESIQEEREEEYRKKVVDSFFEYGKLKSLPVQQKKRRIVLEEIVKNFEYDKLYMEKEVNIIIADINDDFCTIRRALISEKLMERENGVYKRINT